MAALGYLALGIVATLGLSAPAAATIAIMRGTSIDPSAEFIAFIPRQTGPSIQGVTISSRTTFTFTTSTTGETLVGSDNVVSAADGFLEDLSFGPTDPNVGFIEARLPIGTFPAVPLTISAVDQFGRVFSTTFMTQGGSNFFTVLASDGQVIRSVSFTAPTQAPGSSLSLGSGTYRGITSFAAPVPEPAAWALMLIGFGAVGCSMRRRRRVSARFQTA
jgi:hypothetical protein